VWGALLSDVRVLLDCRLPFGADVLGRWRHLHVWRGNSRMRWRVHPIVLVLQQCRLLRRSHVSLAGRDVRLPLGYATLRLELRGIG
jgi:hypothetical protein